MKYKDNQIVPLIFICYNDKCKKNNTPNIINDRYDTEYDERLCSCGESLMYKGIQPSEQGFEDVNFSKISLMTKEQKFAMLKQRSRRHNKRGEEKDRRMEMLANFDKQAKDIIKKQQN